MSLLSNLKEIANEKSNIEASILDFSEFFNNFSTDFAKKY